MHHLLTEALLPMGIIRELSEEEMAEYVAPFKNEGEDRRPTLTFPREIPIEGHPKVSLFTLSVILKRKEKGTNIIVFCGGM